MSLKQDYGRSISSYDECSVHLLSAFFCVTGHTEQDERLRKAIETALVSLSRAQNTAAPSNIIQFCKRDARPSHRA